MSRLIRRMHEFFVQCNSLTRTLCVCICVSPKYLGTRRSLFFASFTNVERFLGMFCNGIQKLTLRTPFVLLIVLAMKLQPLCSYSRLV